MQPLANLEVEKLGAMQGDARIVQPLANFRPDPCAENQLDDH